MIKANQQTQVLDVVIIGGGLVGGLTALLLAQGGVQATVLDAAPILDAEKTLAVANLTWYCIAVIVAAFCDKMVPDTLTVAWFSAWTVELALLAGLKIKSKEENL